MSAMDMDTLSAAFAEHTAESPTFTRRMAIVLADMDGTTPRQLILRCERLGLLKHGSWEWFADNGGITRDQVSEVLSGLGSTPPRPNSDGVGEAGETEGAGR